MNPITGPVDVLAKKAVRDADTQKVAARKKQPGDPDYLEGFGEPDYFRTFEQDKAQAALEAYREKALHGFAQKMQPEWAERLGPGGLDRFTAPIQQLAQQRVQQPMQAAGAYSASAGIGGPVGPAFPGMADLPALQAKVQGFSSYMNMLTGPMAQELLMFDEEALQDWYNQMGKTQLAGGP